MRIYRGTFATETNTFSAIPTGKESFPTLPDREKVWNKVLAPLLEQGAEVFGTVETFAQPSGIIVRAAYEEWRDKLLAEVASALPLDYVVLALHGAMVADGYDDCEGDLLGRIRALVGPDTAIGATLDPHCHLTKEMLDAADLLLTYKKYPHTDTVDRLVEIVPKLIEVKEKRMHPVSAVYPVPVISFYHTDREPMSSFVERIFALEGKDGVISISIAHGFPWGDVPQMGTKVLVYTDGERPEGPALARKLAEELFALRGTTFSPQTPYKEAVRTALSEPGLTVLGDFADNAGGGAPSDSTFLLRELLEQGGDRIAVGPVWDPGAVKLAMLAGEGAHIALRIGGKIGPTSGDPLDVEGTVLAIRPAYTSEMWGGNKAAYGDTVTIRLPGEVDIVLTEIRSQVFTRTFFTGAGVDVLSKRVIVCKSSHHFHADFAQLGDRVIHASSPGTLSVDFLAIPYRRVTRPIWPLDDITALP